VRGVFICGESKQVKRLACLPVIKARRQAKEKRTMSHQDKSKPSVEAVNSAILTKQEAAELLKCTPRFIERAVNSGRLRACKPTGKFVRIYRSDIDAFLQSGASIAAA
jgi:excisionase family DNA binding protein